MREFMNLMEAVVWTKEQADSFVARVSKAAARFDLKIEIVGGVSKRGFSNNDLDLLVTGGEDADLEAFLNSLERLQISHEPMSVLGGPVARLFLSDDREIDIFYR